MLDVRLAAFQGAIAQFPSISQGLDGISCLQQLQPDDIKISCWALGVADSSAYSNHDGEALIHPGC